MEGGDVRVGIPAGWERSGRTVMTNGDFKIAWARVGDVIRFLVTRGAESRMEFRDDVQAALAAVDEWEQGGSGK